MKDAQYIFVTGIDTDVGKTVCSAIICKSLNTDYWKPIQSGDLDNSDSIKVKRFVNDETFKIHPESFRFKTPASPHLAAAIEKIKIGLKDIERPETENKLLIEGAGGLLVPLNETDFISDLIQTTDKVILISKNYLGSINHTLLSAKYLNQKGIKEIGVLFVGDENKSTESIIAKQEGVFRIGRVPFSENLNIDFIKEQAKILKSALLSFLEN